MRPQTTNVREGGKKGFIFTLLVLVVIVFMIAELNIYFRTYQLRQETEPAKIRSMVISDFADQLSQKKLGNTAYLSGYNALYNLTRDFANPPGGANLTSVVWSLMWNGTRPDLAGSPQRIPVNQTLSSWDSKLRSAATAAGFEISTSYSNFNISQADPWTMLFNFTFFYNLTDAASSTRIVSSYPIAFNLSIAGLDDPMTSRAFSGVRRNIFPSATPAQASLLATGEYGKGWFYGEPVKVSQVSQITFTPENKKRILVTDRFAEIARTYGNIYGAVVIVGSNDIQSAAEADLIGVPTFVNQSMSLSNVPDTPFIIVSDNDTQATGTASGYHKMYDIEGIRNLAVCGLYANSTEAPSFTGRLTNNYTADPFGIETIYSGTWVANTALSGVDHEYVAGIGGVKVMGMAGCHDRVSCNISSGLQPARISESHIGRYGLTNLTCTSDRCG